MSAPSSSGSPPAITGSAASRALSGWCAIMGGGDQVSALTLEHYPGMTEKKLAEIEAEAHRRWPLDALADHPPLWPARTRRPDRAGRHRLAAPRGRARRLPFPDRLAEDRRAVLEERGNPAGRALGRRPRRGRCRDEAVAAVHRKANDSRAASGVRAVARRYRNIYDNEEFFAGYSRLRRSVEGLDGAPEWPTLRALLPQLQRAPASLDLGCGFGWFCRWARQQGAARKFSASMFPSAC